MKKNTVFTTSAVAAALALFLARGTARANVYATNVRINDSQTNAVSVAQGAPVTISYILNEAATAGVKVKILSGGTAVRTFVIASGAGTVKGTNSVVWDGKDSSGASVATGSYSVSVTAAANGYSDWTQISDDNAPTSYCNRPRGIAVNKNATSPFYGRIFIGNVQNGPGSATNAWGDVAGIYKVNADGSYSDDGAGRYGTAGYNFSDSAHYDGGDNPIDMKVKEDDRLYWNNWVGDGEVASGDMLLLNSQVVMPESFYTGNPYFPGDNWKSFQITDIQTDHPRLYLCDANFPSGGAWYWPLTNGVVNTNDPQSTIGTQALQTGGDLSLRCDGIAIDAHTNVYVIQDRHNAGDPNMRAACFTNWDGITPLLSGAAWVVGGGDDTFRDQYNMALDSVQSPHYIAVSMSVANTNSLSDNAAWAGIRILNAADGSTVVSNLSLNATYHGVSWDNVGNLYAGSQSDHRWRVWSPPGTNQATTVALALVQVTGALPIIQISSITISGANATITFSGAASDTASSFTVQTSATVTGPYGNATGVSVVQLSPGLFQATVPTSGSAGFCRIKK